MKWIVIKYKMTNFKTIFELNFLESKSTFKETSYDDKNNEFLCQDIVQTVYNLDTLKEINCKKPFISSPDVLFIENNIKMVFLMKYIQMM